MLALYLLMLLEGVWAGVQRGGIIGGHLSAPHSKPWMASLYSKGRKQVICGGFLVKENFVMTAAHCHEHLTDVLVILGVQNVQNRKPSWQTFSKVTPHYFNKKFNKNTYENDILLLELEHPAILNKNVQVIPLPDKDHEIPEGTECNVAGWGRTKINGKVSNDLRDVDVTVLSNEECAEELVLEEDRILDTMMCAGEPNDVKDTNEGDSGGPLVCDGVAEGIVSFGTEYSPPGIYTRISKFLPWIRKTLQHS